VNLKNRWFYFTLTYIYVTILYVLTNRLTFASAHQLPLTWVDLRMPFLPWTAWIYVSVYVSPLLVGWVIDRDQDVKPIVLSFMAMTTLCAAVFVFYPTAYPRPHLDVPIGGSPWSLNNLALHLVRLLDTPANCMPSQHVALAFLSAFYVQRYRKNLGNVFLILGVAIAISTLTTKQHYVWDVVVGYFLARLTFIFTQLKMKVTVPLATAR
jgi:membrane-associated phospholipid phosphatase